LAESNTKRQAENIGFLSPGVSIAEVEDRNRPRQVMGFRDLVLFYVITGISLRWIATAAAAGPSSIVIWVGAWLCFYTPLALSVLELSSRYPNEGGLYVWSKRAFGDFSGFMSAWTYWTSNLPYFPAVLYFAASNVLFMRQAAWQHLSNNATFYIVFALLTLRRPR
jgi:glutamate:GABA antiporter